MSGTNAIHGIVLLGGLLVVGLSGNGDLQQDHPRDRHRLRHDQRGRRLPRHRPDARDVQVQAQIRRGRGGEGLVSLPLASFLQNASFLDVLYIIAFGLFIQGLRGLSGPTTAVRGNRIAAVGMAIAVIATLLNHERGQLGPDRHSAWRSARRSVCRLRAGEDDRDAADGGAVQRRRRRRRVPDLLVGVPPLGSTYGSHPIHVSTARRGDLVHITAASHLRGDLLPVRGDRRLGLLLGLEHRLRQAPGNHPRPPDHRSAPAQQFVNLLLLLLAARRRASTDRRRRALRNALHRHAARARHCSATPSCCRSAAPTCPS